MFDVIPVFHGFDVTSVGDGRKAMEIRKGGTLFDAAMLDPQLPGMPGVEIFDMLKQRDDTKKVLVVSAYLDELRDFEIRGVNALQKPVLSMDLLVDRVREIAEQKVPALR